MNNITYTYIIIVTAIPPRHRNVHYKSPRIRIFTAIATDDCENIIIM